MSETAKAVITCLENITGRNDITEDMVFGTDIFLTSVNAMKMVYDLETMLDIDEIAPEIIYSVETVSDLICVVEEMK